MNPCCETTPRRHFLGRVVLGVLVIAVGLALLLHNLDLLPLHLSYRWWPLILVAIALARIVERGFLALGPQVLLLVGLFLFAGFMGREEFLETWWPLALVWLGILVTARAALHRTSPAACEDHSERPS